jgi:glycosyltransferase involved in cell wall biosynthesis
MKKKVLIVSYYWPPSGGGGVQRWLKMTRYLHEAGWEPIVYTPENPSFDVKDPSLEKYIRPGLQIIRRPIFEPIEIFFSLFKLTGKKKPEQKDFLANRNKSLFQRLSTWIRGNVLLPDPRVMWVRPSVRYLNQWMKTDDIQAIITTGPPHSMHLIGRQLKKKHPRLIWIADFRDPWSEWDLWPMLQTGPSAMSRIRAMERNVLREASAVVSISKYHVDRLSELGGIQAVLIPNGYDHADFAKAQKLRSPQFVIRHMGSVDDLRDPRPFMKAIELTINFKFEPTPTGSLFFRCRSAPGGHRSLRIECSVASDTRSYRYRRRQYTGQDVRIHGLTHTGDRNWSGNGQCRAHPETNSERRNDRPTPC